MVVAGEFSPSFAFISAIQTYFQALSAFGFNAQDPAQDVGQVFTIDDTGLVTLRAASPFAINSIVTLNRLTTNTGLTKLDTRITGIGPLASQFTVAGWPANTTATAGTVSLKGRSNYTLDASQSSVVRALVRKVGRNFEQYRGRKSKRRKVA
jgi:hypothetical protein